MEVMERITCQVPKFDRLLDNAIPKDWIGSMDKVGSREPTSWAGFPIHSAILRARHAAQNQPYAMIAGQP